MMHPDIVLTTYFTGKVDPQQRSRGKYNLVKKIKTWWRSRQGGAKAEKPGVADIDDFERIEIWYNSLLKVGCHGVIFYDQLSPGFVEKWTRPEITFVHYSLATPRSLNDERYYCYRDFLLKHPEIKRIFMLDLFDVEFFSNPFILIDDSQFDILCGGDPGEYNDRLNREKMLSAFNEAHYESCIKLHAGTCGGSRNSIMKLLDALVIEFDRLTAEGNLDNLNMAVYNKCVYDLFEKDRILYGNPLNSRFKAYEQSGNFAIRHK